MKHIRKRLLSLVMAVLLVASLLPAGALAEDIVYTEVADETALLAAIAGGQNPKLTAGITLSAALEIPADKSITLDLNGQALTTYSSATDTEGTVNYTQYQVTVSGTLTVLDSSEGKTGTVAAIPAGASNFLFLVNSGATLNLNGGTLVMDGTDINTVAAYCIRNNGTTTVSGATINVYSAGSNAFCFYNTGTLTVNEGSTLHSTGSGAKNSAAAIYATKGAITIEGGTIYAKNLSTSTSYAIQLNASSSTAAANYPTLTVNGGTITAEHSGYRDARAIFITRGTATINGGTITGNTDGAYKSVSGTKYYNPASGIYLTANGKATVNGGTITATAAGGRAFGINLAATSSEVVVNDGTITANTAGSYSGYGICGGGTPDANIGGKLTVNGGTITGNGTKATTYGIYVDGPKTVTMNGGIVNADTTGGSASAIGISIGSGTVADLKGGTVNVNANSGNATGVSAAASLTTDVTGETPVISGATRSTVNFPADSKEMTISAITATGSAYGINSDGGTINADSPKLTSTAKTGFAATSGSTMKYAYGITVQGRATITAGKFEAYGTNNSTTKVQAFGINNSRKSVTATLADESTVTLYDESIVTISGGSFHGSVKNGTGSGIMTNYSGGLTVTGDTVATGSHYAMWFYRGTVEVTGGTFSSDGSRVVNIASGATVAVSGGMYKHNDKNAIVNSGKLTLTGGQFVGDIGRGAVDITHLLDTTAYKQDIDGNVVAGAETPKFAVTVGDTTTEYISYWDAVDAVNADTTGNAKMKLLKDIYLGAFKKFTTSVEIDLNGKTWRQSNGTAIDVEAAGTENDITRVVNGTIINDYASVAIYIRAGGIQLDGVTAYGHTTMPVCYTAPTYATPENNYVKNSNLITNRFYCFSYRTQTAAQTDMDVLFENTNLVSLYAKANGGEIFFTGWGETTGQYTLGEGVNMYTVYATSTLQRQNTTDADGKLTVNTAGSETVKAVAAEGCTVHDRQDAASYADINAILADLNDQADLGINETPSLYKWTTEHSYADGACSCGDNNVATVGDTTYTSLSDALDAAMESTNAETVILNGNHTTQDDLLVADNISLDLNGKDLSASSLTVYGDLVDGTTGGNALVISENFHVTGSGYLALYDQAAGGYRFYKHELNELGSKIPSENKVKFGFRLTLDNAAGYKLLQDADNKITLKGKVSWSGDFSGSISYTFQASTLASLAKALDEGQATVAITLTVGGTDVLGENGTLSFTPDMSSDCGMSVDAAGMTWSAGNG